MLDHFHRLSNLSIAFATVAIAIGIARMALIFRQNLTMLAGSRVEATTDALTGLRNRRALLDRPRARAGRGHRRRAAAC